ncbi:glycosyltransferase [Pseudoalteromonas xiamenensis]|uniref:Glycosyltransferase n=1 Tax=Pseudoalteromonas xiamenensis TaxID=882626 RepID=A0A975DIZ7_9GAMM|nr:glycosyltransferase [Pseudoalteromonas xiamenensis]QTH72585.1 glycosyltransferase [Pseudoalteromonas xiamenensis]
MVRNLAIFVDSFPSRSETFVTNQIMALLDAGVNVTILSVYRGDVSLFEQCHLKPYKLAQRTCYLLDELPSNSALKKLLQRTKQVLATPIILALLVNIKKRALPVQTLKLLACASRLKEANTTFDWVVCHFGHNGVFANQLRHLRLIQGKIATIFHGADISAVEPDDAVGRAYRTMLEDTELALPISELWARKIKRLGVPADKIVIQRMGVELTRFHFRFTPHTQGPLKVFCAARFSEKKGLLDAIDAIAIASKHTQLHFELGGFGELEPQIKAHIASKQLAEHISLLGPLSSEQVLQKLNESHVYLLPSITASNGDREGVPVALMEAMAAGVPVVSTQHSGIPELIDHEVSGLLAPERSPEVLASYLVKLAIDDSLREKLAISARNKIEWFSDVDKLNKQLMQTLANR